MAVPVDVIILSMYKYMYVVSVSFQAENLLLDANMNIKIAGKYLTK
jgi:hypothetical protein